MTTFMNYVECPLYGDPYYAYPVVLEGETFTLKFAYNEIMKLYTLSILDSQNYVLCSGVGITPYYPLIVDYDLRGLTGIFQLQPIGDNSVEYYKLYPESLHKYYKFYYYFNIE